VCLVQDVRNIVHYLQLELCASNLVRSGLGLVRYNVCLVYVVRDIVHYFQNELCASNLVRSCLGLVRYNVCLVHVFLVHMLCETSCKVSTSSYVV